MPQLLRIADCAAHFGSRNQLHGFRDLVGRFDRLHLAPDIAEVSGHLRAFSGQL
jgi:hypothetical protein